MSSIISIIYVVFIWFFIKTVLEHNLKLDLSKLINETLELLPVKADVKKDVEEFFVQRLIIFLNSDYSKNILEEVIYSISLSAFDNYDIKEVIFEVNNEEIYKSVLKTIE